MKKIKSICPVQRRQLKGGGFRIVTDGGQGLWDVRIRFTNGTEILVSGDFPYTLSQAGAVASATRANKYQYL